MAHFVRSIVASVLGTAGVVGCSNDHHPPPCPKNQPAFRLQLTAPGGVLPPDTQLTVNYSGNREERYSLSRGGLMNTDVCCRTGDPVKGRLPDVGCTPPSLSSSGPLRDAAYGRDASPRRDGAMPSMRDAMPATRDAAIRVRDGSVPSLGDASVVDAAGSADGAPPGPVALLCDLWTNGYADVTISASGYPEFAHEPFEPNVPDPRCGVVTVDLRILLGHTDAGVSE